MSKVKLIKFQVNLVVPDEATHAEVNAFIREALVSHSLNVPRDNTLSFHFNIDSSLVKIRRIQ